MKQKVHRIVQLMINTHFLYLEFKLWYLSISNSSEIPILYNYKSFQSLQKCRHMSEGCHIKRYDIVKGCKILGINTNINNHGKKNSKEICRDLILIRAPDT